MNSHQRYSEPSRRDLERTFKHRSAVRSDDVWATAQFDGCPRPPNLCRDLRLLEKWRRCNWAGSPGKQKVLSLSNRDLLAAYRRIWGCNPLHLHTVTNRLGDRVPEFNLSRGEIGLMAWHLFGHGDGPPAERVIAEKPRVWF